MTTRQEIEADIRACNKLVAPKVKEMTILQLLRNCHPMYRVDYVRRLLREEIISKEIAEKFTKIT